MKRKITALIVVAIAIAILVIVLPEDEPAVADSRSDSISRVLPDGYSVHVNSGMSWNINIASEDVAEVEKLVETSIGGNEYKKYVSLPQLADRSLYAVIYAIDPGDGSSVPYIFLFDNDSNELLDYICLETADNEVMVQRALVAVEKFSQTRVDN